MNDVLKTFIEIAAKSGINQTTIVEACILCNQPEAISLFKDDESLILSAIEEEINKKIIEDLSPFNTQLKLGMKIKTILMHRLFIYSTLKNYREFLREKINFFSSVKHLPSGLKQLYKTVDFIWELAGDHPTDFNFYTKRLTLAILYKATLMKFINDSSPNLIETEIYLDKQLQKIHNFARIKFRVKKIFH